MRYKSLLNLPFTFIHILYGIMFSGIILLCLFGQDLTYYCKKTYPADNWIYLLTGLLVTSLLYFILEILHRKTALYRYIDNIILLLNILLGIFLLVASWHYYFRTGWDAEIVLHSAEWMTHQTAPDPLVEYYYSTYPNNLFMTFLFSLVIRTARLLGIENYNYCLIVLQCILYALAGWLFYKTAGYVWNQKTTSVWVWFLYLGLVGTSPWVTIPYSDSIAMVMVVGACFCFFKSAASPRKYRWIFAFAVLSGLGYNIKPQAAILAIALALLAFFHFLQDIRSSWKNMLRWYGVFAAGVAAALVITQITAAASGVTINKNKTYGITHFAMMGLNERTNGVFNEEDVLFSELSVNQEERNKANIQVIKERLVHYGIKGLIPFYIKKMLTVYHDGTFAWAQEGGFVQEEYSHGSPALQDALKQYYYPTGEHYPSFLNMTQTLWMTVLFLCLILCFKKQSFPVMVLMLSLIGLTLFEGLFEARARYLFAYVPVFILLAGGGMQTLLALLKKR